MKKIHKRIAAVVMALAMAVGVMTTGTNVAEAATTVPTVNYRVHIQTLGDKQGWVKNGETAGTMGKAKRLEEIKIEIKGNQNLGVEYRTHIQSKGWEKTWAKNGAASGTRGSAKRLEAIQIRLTGTDASKYDIYYRVHAQTYGWLGWAKNGEYSGTAGQAKRLEGIQIKVLPKGQYPTEGSLGCAFVDLGKKPSIEASGAVQYKTHVQTYGNQKYVADGAVSGTFGEAKRLEAIYIKLNKSALDYPNLTGDIEYRTHIQSIGWEKTWAKNAAMSGTAKQAKRLEAIQIRLTGEMAQYYDVYYRVHAQTYGWLAWAKNGQTSGTSGQAKRLEGIQIVVVPKGTEAPNSLPSGQKVPFVSKTNQDVVPAATEVAATALSLGTDIKPAIGSTTKLTPSIEPANTTNKRLVYTSSNEDVATVDNMGNVKAVAVGEAVITATTTDGSKKSASIKVVVAPATVAPASITVTPASMDLKVGDAPAQITATVAPDNATDKKVTYTSVDPKVATVTEDGKVTAVGRGSTQILVVSAADSTVYSAVTVTVSDDVVTKVAVVDGAKATITVNSANGSGIVTDLDQAVKDCADQLSALEGSDWTVTDVDAGNDIYTVKYANGAITYYNEDNQPVDHATVATRIQGCQVEISIPVGNSSKVFSTLQTLQDNSGYATSGKEYKYSVTITKDSAQTLSNLKLSNQYTTFEADGTTYQVYMKDNKMYVVGDVKTKDGVFKAMETDKLVELTVE